MDEVFADPQVRHLGMAQPLETRTHGRTEFTQQPMFLSRTPSAFVAEPPTLGEHTDEILGEFGYSAAEIAAFRRNGTV
jgi:crotonobetainyl-CoA:carnitine CoA-transferase CaiB-like acyl-CoA transferase